MNKLHTPGPWTAEPSLVGLAIMVNDRFVGEIQEHADAKLVAAAPDLLAAARRVLRDPKRNPQNRHAMGALAHAVHAATGSLYCEHCKGTGRTHTDEESTPCTRCLDGREVAEQEARNV
jgi:hypothetical protein